MTEHWKDDIENFKVGDLIEFDRDDYAFIIKITSIHIHYYCFIDDACYKAYKGNMKRWISSGYLKRIGK